MPATELDRARAAPTVATASGHRGSTGDASTDDAPTNDAPSHDAPYNVTTGHETRTHDDDPPTLHPTLGLLTRREWRAHPWRYAVIVLALALGVALAWSVHLINASALAEFAAAVRTTQGEPDASLRGVRGPGGGLPDALLDRLADDPAVAHAVGVIEVDTYARRGDAQAQADGASMSVERRSDAVDRAARSGQRVALRLIGLDALSAGALLPTLVPRVTVGDGAAAVLDPSRVFVNPAARDALGVRDGETIALQSGARWLPFVVSGDVPAAGAPLVVIDIAAVQAGFAGQGARLSRIDLRLAPGASTSSLAVPLPAGATWAHADDGEQRVSSLSRAYRVNLMVLALVALLVGAFMAYSVVALAVAQRTPAFALLGVLGLTAAERRRLVLRECAWLGAAGSALGIAAGTALAWWALRRLGGDLGGGYFPGVTPTLRFDVVAAIGMALLGVAAALVGGWVPARHAQRLRPAVALKGLGGGVAANPRGSWIGWALLAAGALLALLPPVMGVPVAAYASVAALLFGGVALVPWVVARLLAWWPVPTSAIGRLALRRAAFHRHTAMAVVAGVVASLALSVALTVMVQSFRSSVAGWLDQVLPADLYARTAVTSALAEQAFADAGFEQRAAALPGVARAEAASLRSLTFAAERPPVTLIARRLGDNPADRLPLVEAPAKPVPGQTGVYVSEAMAALYGARVGTTLRLPLTMADGTGGVDARVLGIWRDFARQFGSIVLDLDAYRRLTGDVRVNELQVWLAPGADLAAVQARLRDLAARGDGQGAGAPLDFVTTAELRSVSLRIFDRSFAVTTYLQTVAIVIGLVGVAAGLSAQVLARRKEFGLLAHLGLVRRDVLRLVASETAAWLVVGALVGVLLGLAIGAILVHVVNPQSFHWTMTMKPPWPAIAALAAAMVGSGVVTAWIGARMTASRDAVRAVREDW
jgi:putative ABC transport system permease protein